MNKAFEKISKFFIGLISQNYKSNHKFLNKNQVSNSYTIINLLKIKGFRPKNIVDVGAGHGEWTLMALKIFSHSNYFLFDANKKNENSLLKISNIYPDINFKICLLSDDEKTYDFYNMGSGSSIYEEKTSHKRVIEQIKSTTLEKELSLNILRNKKNLLKIDVQGAELKILKGLGDSIEQFEVIIMEVSVIEYNKNSPLFLDVINYMNSKFFRIYDIYDLKRLGNERSFLLQFDTIFVKQNSTLFNVSLN